MRLRYKIGLVLVVLGTTFGLGRCKRNAANGPKSSVPTVLPSNDIEQIRVNPETHQLIITTAKGTQTVTLPDKTSTIDVLKNGTVKVTSPQFGFQVRPFAGVYYSDALRFGAGADLGYWKKLDIGVGIAGGASAHTVAFAQLSYNIWDNVGVGLTYDHLGHIGGGITLRI
jgi:hypothetical protein